RNAAMSENDQRLLSLFTAALDHAEGPERSAYMDNACGGDSALRARVEALLLAHAQAGRFLAPDAPNNPTATISTTTPLPAKTGPAAGMLVAERFRLLEVIGEGGMGIVWLADQMEPVRRQVALKLIKSGMDSKQVLARFEAERQAL